MSETANIRLLKNADPFISENLDKIDAAVEAVEAGGISQATADSTVAAAVVAHNLVADPHAGYRLESADHSHESAGGQAGKLDHGAALNGLADDDHTQYHTAARALTWLGTRSTTDLPQGSNEYYTNAKADARVALGVGIVGGIGFVIDGGGVAITTGIKGDIQVPFACIINSVTLLADQSGSIVIDIWKDSYANYPPVVGDSITASAKPTISTAVKATDATLTGWTTALAAGDTLRFNVDSITTLTRCAVILKVTRT